jgi:kumamolisin
MATTSIPSAFDRRCQTGQAAISASLLLLGFSQAAFAAVAESAYSVIVPDSSIDRIGDIGKRFHTNILILQPPGQAALLPPSRFGGKRNQATPGAGGETPASLACVYRLVSPPQPGCNPATTSAVPNGGAGAIAVVDAYDDPTAASDLGAFSGYFGLPGADFAVVYASGTKPASGVSKGWAVEEALDVEWAHAMAPHAKIFLVEAASNSTTDLFNAVSMAGNLVAAQGGGEVSMSWTGGEYRGETSDDSSMTTPTVVYFASAGDSPGVFYPAASPNVVAAGGTTIKRDGSGNFTKETTWQRAGGGTSRYEARPVWQNGIAAIVGAWRGTPDLSFDADPSSGVWIYGQGQWIIVGGTSVAAPSLAGIVNAAASFDSTSAVELTMLYTNRLNPQDFTDIVTGHCGPDKSYSAVTGWDFCTGIGSVLGLSGK